MDSKLLDKLLNDYSVKREALKHQTTKDHRNEIAKRIGAQWESLATFIGVCDEEVHDVKEKYKEPLDMRLAIMRRWNELCGREATYLKLVGGLMQVGRKDLIETVLQWRKRETRSNLQRQCHSSILISGMVIICFSTILLITMLLIKSTVPENLPTERYPGKHTVLTNSDLPRRHKEIFVGRESDVLEVLSRVARKNIVNINGAPGFGKSALAKHVGHEILRNGTLVQYINIEEKLSLFNKAFKSTDGEIKPESFKHSQKIQETQYLVELGGSPLEISIINNYYSSENQHQWFIDELINWSEGISCYTVLILDNCDDILVSSIDEKFNDLIKSLVRKSKFNLHIIITSRLKLLYLDWFDSWTVKELNVSASIQLLDKIAPGIGDDHLTEIAEVAEGCPLALKVIGQLLHIHGAELTHSLKRDLMTNLEKASDKRERFPLIMDVAFSRLGECGYSLSLFPGSFDKSAANAVVPSQEKECIESYVRHSLVDEYFIPHQHRYQMHSLIRTYFKAKALLSDQKTNITKFKRKYRDHFVHFVLKYGKKPELDSIEMDILSSELHNLHYLRTILLRNRNFSGVELAALALLVHVKDLHMYYPLYMKKINDVCTHLNPKSCWNFYFDIVRIDTSLQCKCTLQNIKECWVNYYVIISPCVKHFHYETLKYLSELQETTKVVQDELEIKVFEGFFWICTPWYEKYIIHICELWCSPEKHLLEIAITIIMIMLSLLLLLLLSLLSQLNWFSNEMKCIISLLLSFILYSLYICVKYPIVVTLLKKNVVGI